MTRVVPPLLPGVPTSDKLHAWRLTEYTQCVVFDLDVLVLQNIDDLFGRPEELTIAHHPSDHLQSQCGVPLRARGVAAMFALRPKLATFNELVRYVRRRFVKPRQQMCARRSTPCLRLPSPRSRPRRPQLPHPDRPAPVGTSTRPG